MVLKTMSMTDMRIGAHRHQNHNYHHGADDRHERVVQATADFMATSNRQRLGKSRRNWSMARSARTSK